MIKSRWYRFIIWKNSKFHKLARKSEVWRHHILQSFCISLHFTWSTELYNHWWRAHDCIGKSRNCETRSHLRHLGCNFICHPSGHGSWFSVTINHWHCHYPNNHTLNLLPIWQKRQKNYLFSTEWTKAQGYTTDQLKLFGHKKR